VPEHGDQSVPVFVADQSTQCSDANGEVSRELRRIPGQIGIMAGLHEGETGILLEQRDGDPNEPLGE
jgi:hypothetical protein